MRALAVALAATVLASYLLSRQNLNKAKVITLGRGGRANGRRRGYRFRRQRQERRTDDAYGVFTFSVWNAFPKQHRVKFTPPETHGHFRPPAWPLAAAIEFGRTRSDFRYDPEKPADQRFYVVGNRNNPLTESIDVLRCRHRRPAGDDENTR